MRWYRGAGAARAESALAALEAKYCKPAPEKKRKKPKAAEPSEEDFAAAQKRLKMGGKIEAKAAKA